MGENFQAGVCGSTWWSSPRGSIGFSSPCLMSVNDNGNFGWPIPDLVEIKARPSATRGVSNVTFNQGSICFDHFMQKPSECTFVDSTLQMMDISRSSKTTSTTTDWSHNLFSESESNETNYQSPMLQENMNSSRPDLRHESDMYNPPNNQIQNEWGLKNFSQDSTINEQKQTSTTQGIPIHPNLPSSSFNYPSTLIENLFGDDQLPLENQTMPTASYQTNLNEFSPSLTNLPSSIRPSLRQRQEIDPSHLINNIPFWNGSSAAPNHISASLFHSAQLVEKTNFRNLKPKSNNGLVRDSKKSSTEAAPKKPRIETPSLLPTFKVRKEKLGDRITALQQLVSPFGKTDTASVLQEAIEYIKFLHDQVNVLSTPYIKNGSPIQHQQKFDTVKDPEGLKQDLRGRGLCLVPISSMFPAETTVDFWTPTFGGTFG